MATREDCAGIDEGVVVGLVAGQELLAEIWGVGDGGVGGDVDKEGRWEVGEVNLFDHVWGLGRRSAWVVDMMADGQRPIET